MIRKPVFGVTRIRSKYASLDNPQRDGIYVETIYRRGRMNRGKHYRLTNGRGEFWLVPMDNIEEVEEEA